jgi:hypothetical protein
VAEQALHRDEVRAEHQQQAAVGMAQVVEPDVPDLPLRPELHRVTASLIRPLRRLLNDVCGTLDRANFWVAYCGR